MNDEEILKYIRSETMDMAFKDNENCIKFIDFLVYKKMVSDEQKRQYYNRHHITFFCGLRDIVSNICMQNSDPNPNKKLVYYEDLMVGEYIVDLL